MSRFNCPRCTTLLDDTRLDGLRLYHCHTCNGHAINVSQIRSRLPEGAFAAMWQAARAAEACGPGCPVCGKGMRVIQAGKAKVEVDVCVGCQMLWLDAGEQEKLGVVAAVGTGGRGTGTVEKEAGRMAADVLLAKAKVASDADRHERQRKVERRSWWIGGLLEALMWWSI